MPILTKEITIAGASAQGKSQTMESLRARAKINGDCWEWQGPKTRKGYGQARHNGAQSYVHRLSYTLYFGPIEAGQLVCHRCDNPSCFNPAHLFTGTMKDNKRDCANKGRCRNQGATQCEKGHIYDERDWRTHSRDKDKRVRYCRLCQQEKQRQRYHKRKNLPSPQ